MVDTVNLSAYNEDRRCRVAPRGHSNGNVLGPGRVDDEIKTLVLSEAMLI